MPAPENPTVGRSENQANAEWLRWRGVCEELAKDVADRRRVFLRSFPPSRRREDLRQAATFAAETIVERAKAFRIPHEEIDEWVQHAITSVLYAVGPDDMSAGSMNDRRLLAHLLCQQFAAVAIEGGSASASSSVIQAKGAKEAVRDVLADGSSVRRARGDK